MNLWMPSLASGCGEQRAIYFQVKPKIQHQDGTERPGRDMLWACRRLSVRFFTLLWGTFSVSRLIFRATCTTVDTAGQDTSYSPSSSGSHDYFSIITSFFLLDRDGLILSVSWELSPKPSIYVWDRAAGCNQSSSGEVQAVKQRGCSVTRA